ncbi:MAG: hypothetical protein OHK0017_05340 [Patescibacteria group bacterium]
MSPEKITVVDEMFGYETHISIQKMNSSLDQEGNKSVVQIKEAIYVLSEDKYHLYCVEVAANQPQYNLEMESGMPKYLVPSKIPENYRFIGNQTDPIFSTIQDVQTGKAGIYASDYNINANVLYLQKVINLQNSNSNIYTNQPFADTSILDGILTPGGDIYSENTQDGDFRMDEVRKLFIGDGDIQTPEGSLVKAFNLPMVVTLFRHGSQVVDITWFPILNLGLSIQEYIDFLIYNFRKKKSQFESSSFWQSRLSPFVMHDSAGRTLTCLANIIDLPINRQHKQKDQIDLNGLSQILLSKEFRESINLNECPTFKWDNQLQKYLKISPNQAITQPNNLQFLSDQDFRKAVENFSYTCVDAMLTAKIKGEVCVAIVKRRESEKVVYPEWWIVGGRSKANLTPQLALANLINQDLFGNDLQSEDIADLATNLKYFSHNNASYRDPSRQGAAKSTTNLTFTTELDEQSVSKIKSLNPSEYEGEVHWIPVKGIQQSYTGGSVSLPAFDSTGNVLQNVIINIDEDQPGVALWNKLKALVEQIKLSSPKK